MAAVPRLQSRVQQVAVTRTFVHLVGDLRRNFDRPIPDSLASYRIRRSQHLACYRNLALMLKPA